MYLPLLLRFSLLFLTITLQIRLSNALNIIQKFIEQELSPTGGELDLRDTIEKNEKLLKVLRAERKALRGAEQESVDHFISQTVKVTDEAKRVLMDDRIPREQKSLDSINPKDIYLQHLLERYYGLFIANEQPKKIGKRVFKHVKLVKRKVPLGYNGPKYEFDDEKGTMYKPLIKAMRPPRASLYNNLVPRQKKSRSQDLSSKEEQHIDILSRAIARFLVNNRNDWNNDPLRMHGYTDAERYKKIYDNPYMMSAHGSHHQLMKEYEMRDPVIENQAPKNVLWNTWTYHKNPYLLEEEGNKCPGMSIWVNNMCIKTPPHYRRFLQGD